MAGQDLEFIVKTQNSILGGDLEDFKVKDINNCLSYSDDHLRTLGQQDCDLVAYKLTRHKLYLQSKLNINKAYLNRLKLELKKTAVVNIRQYKGVSWENAEQLSINNDDAAVELQIEILDLSNFITAIEGIIPILDDYGRRLDSIKFWRKSNE